MTIVLAHNYYQLAGGEDRVFESEARLLASRGHNVLLFTERNHRIPGIGLARLLAATLWNHASAAALRKLLRTAKADVVHFHNTFPLLSPSCYYAARSQGAAVVQTLHNFRFFCPAGTLFRSGACCEDCLSRALPWPAVLHACYRRSRPATSVVASMLILHRLLRTQSRAVDVYVTLTESARERFVAAGIPQAKIVLKPNFVDPVPQVGNGSGGFALYAGRLVEEKGIPVLLAAWRRLSRPLPLRIVGDGPLAPWLRAQLPSLADAQYLGPLPNDMVLQLMREAACLVFPSVCFEGMPMAILEAYAVGLPVIASSLGSLAGIVQDRLTGLHFRPGDPDDLAAKLDWYFRHPEAQDAMRLRARDLFRSDYTAESSYRALMDIYTRAIAARHPHPDPLARAKHVPLTCRLPGPSL